MSDISIPIPIVKGEDVALGLTIMEKLIKVSCAAVVFNDGTVFNQSNLGTAGFFIYRLMTAISPTEIWNEDNKIWEPDSGTIPSSLKLKPLLFKQGDPFPWQGPLVAVGQKDKNDNDQFQQATGLYPQYFIRAYFASMRNGNLISDLSAPSSTIRFVSITDVMRAGIRVDKKPETANEVELFLRNDTRQDIGLVTIKNDGNQGRIEISNFDAIGGLKAQIILHSTGDIEIRPASGRQIIFSGTIGSINAERIFYQPADINGNPIGVKRWLS